MTTSTKPNGLNPVERTFRTVEERLRALRTFVATHPDEIQELTQLADSFNEAREAHVKALKASRVESPLYKMTIPKTYEMGTDVATAKEQLGDQFPEYFEEVVKPKTSAIRNALASNPDHKVNLVVKEVEETPRHTGPKAIDLTALFNA